MSDRLSSPSFEFPNCVSIVGGGRWARVITSTVCSLVPKETSVDIYSKSNATGMQEWAAQQEFAQSVSILPERFEDAVPKSGVAIVANAAVNHTPAVKAALTAGVPVLVEKPFAPTLDQIIQMTDLAAETGVYLASAHVFLFANYLRNFADAIQAAGPVKTIEINWCDPKNESRDGGRKSFDSSLPVFVDCLPHIVSILSALIGTSDITYSGISTKRGGAQTNLTLIANGVEVTVRLERNAQSRQRTIAVEAEQGLLSLDFSNEPGTITAGDEARSADLDWSRGPRPMAQMIQAFLQSAGGTEPDPRLNTAVALSAGKLIDAMHPDYAEAMSEWLGDQLLRDRSVIDDDLRYALVEALQKQGSHPPQQLDKMIEELAQACADDNPTRKQTVEALVSGLFEPNSL